MHIATHQTAREAKGIRRSALSTKAAATAIQVLTNSRYNIRLGIIGRSCAMSPLAAPICQAAAAR
ncbi:MAG TPA: hypothetical protein VIC03_08695, partial [Gemmatimonadaceae bacterium]